MINEEADRIIDRKETDIKTFHQPMYVWIGTGATLLGGYYFGYQFRAERVEQWLPLGIVSLSGVILLIASRVGWKIPGSKFSFTQREYIFDTEQNVLQIAFSSSSQPTTIEKSINLNGVKSFSYRVNTQSGKKTNPARSEFLILEPLGRKIPWKHAPEQAELLVKHLNQKWEEILHLKSIEEDGIDIDE